jgi:hypothetical protein
MNSSFSAKMPSKMPGKMPRHAPSWRGTDLPDGLWGDLAVQPLAEKIFRFAVWKKQL